MSRANDGRALQRLRVCERNREIQGVFAAARDITERKQAETKLAHSREAMRALAASVEWAREEERKRIAREIHDELGHALTD